jgi:hypothetical protein
MLNGIYTLRLVATDAASQTAISSIVVVVDGQRRVHFNLLRPTHEAAYRHHLAAER